MKSVSSSGHRDESEASEVQKLLENLDAKMPSGKISMSDYSSQIADANRRFANAYRGKEIAPGSFIARVGNRLNQALVATGQSKTTVNWDSRRQIPNKSAAGRHDAEEKKRSSAAERVEISSKKQFDMHPKSGAERAFASDLNRGVFKLGGSKSNGRHDKFAPLASE